MEQRFGRPLLRDTRPKPQTKKKSNIMKTLNWLKWAAECTVSATGSTLKLATGLTGSAAAMVTGVAGGAVAVAGGAVAITGGAVYLGGCAIMHQANRLGNVSADLSDEALKELTGQPEQESQPQNCLDACPA